MIVAPDLTVAARDCIRDGLAALGVPAQSVSTKVPNPRPARFITLQVFVGRKKNLRVGYVTVVALVHDAVANEVRAGEVARKVAAVLEAAVDTVPLVNIATVESIVQSDDPAVAALCRFQVTATWTVAYPV